jgi:hypothetical protein
MLLLNLLAADAFTPSTRQVALVALLAATILYAYWYSRRRTARVKWPKLEEGKWDSGATHSASRNEMATLVRQLDEQSRLIEGRLEAKVASLEQSIQNADQRIAVLRTLLIAAQSAGVQLESGRAASTDSRAQMASLDPRTRRIYELADAGRSIRQIAQETDQRIGEVELILNLRETAHRPNDRAA